LCGIFLLNRQRSFHLKKKKKKKRVTGNRKSHDILHGAGMAERDFTNSIPEGKMWDLLRRVFW